MHTVIKVTVTWVITYVMTSHWTDGKSLPTAIAKILGSASIRYRPDTFTTDWYLITVDSVVVAVWQVTAHQTFDNNHNKGWDWYSFYLWRKCHWKWHPFCLGPLSWYQKFGGNLHQYHGCWCPVIVRRQAIGSHVIGCADRCLSLSRKDFYHLHQMQNYRKCRFVFMLSMERQVSIQQIGKRHYASSWHFVCSHLYMMICRITYPFKNTIL